MRELLDGTTSVRLSDSDGHRVHFEGPVSFRGNDAALALPRHPRPPARRRQGRSPDPGVLRDRRRRTPAHRRGHRPRDRRPARPRRHRRPHQLRLPARRRPRRAHDRARLRRRPRLPERPTHPADIVRESFRMERELRALGWKVVRMSGADLKLFLPLPDGRVVHIDVFGAFHVEGTFYQLGGRSGALDRASADPRLGGALEGVELAAPADPEAVLEFLYGAGLAGARPAVQPGRPRGPACAGSTAGCVACAPTWSPGTSSSATGAPRSRGGARPSPSWVGPAAWPGGVHGRRPRLRHRTRLGVVRRQGAPGRRLRLLRRRTAPDQQPAGRAGECRAPTCAPLPLNDLRAALLAGAELSREPDAAVPLRARAGRLPRRSRRARTCGGLCSMSLRRGGALFLEYAATRPGIRGGTPPAAWSGG